MHGAGSAHDDVALGADVGETFERFSLREWECVAGGFAGDAEVGAGGFPFDAVRSNASSAVAFTGDEVGEFVEDDAGDLVFGDVGLEKLWVKGDEGFFWGGESGRASESA